MKCLRYIAAKNEITDYLYISIVNPARYPADGNQCECFKTAVKVHVAWGLKRLLDRIPYDELGSIRVIDDEGEMISIIENGRFVLPGTEELNRPFENLPLNINIS